MTHPPNAWSVKSAPSSSAAGKLTVLGLDGIRIRLGDQWGKTSEKVHAFFVSLLQREMRPGDVFYKLDELSYLVVFRDLSATEAQVKCLSIADTVSRRLFGEETGTVSIRSVVGTFDNRLPIEDVDVRSALHATLEATGMETITTSDRGETSHRVVDPRPELPQKQISSGQRRLQVTFGPDHDGSQILPENQLSFEYRPVWDSTRKVVLMYLCQPTPAASATALAPSPSPAYGLCQALDNGESCILDLLVLEEVTKQVESVQKAGFRILAACPVHFTTLARSRSWAEYSCALQRIRADVFRDIAFLVVGIDSGTPNIRLVQEIPKISTRAKLVFVAIAYCEGIIQRFSNTRIHAIGVELRRSQGSERQALASVDALARDAHALGIDSFVLGAKSRSAILSAIGSGVRYLEGPSVSPPVAEPRHAFVREIADLYRAS
jgi:hypothetical protein